MPRGARPVLLAAAAALAASAPLTGDAGARDSGTSRPASGAGDTRKAHARPVHRTSRVRKLARRRGSWGHVPDWLKLADPFAAGAPGTPGGVPQTPGPAPVTPQPPAPTPPACGAATGAREGEWYLKPSRTTLCAGQVTIEAQNYGQDPHDMRLQRENGPEIASWPELSPGSPGGVLARKVTLTPGRYTLYCSLTGGTPPGTPGESHAAAGMTANLNVIAP